MSDISKTTIPRGSLDDPGVFMDDEPTPICPITGTYCSGDFCDDYGCAKAAGVWDDEEDYL